MNRWVTWRYEQRTDDRHWAKMPIECRHGRACNVQQNGSWVSYQDAVRYFEAQSTSLDGVGFVLNGDGIVGWDFDYCLDVGQRVKPWAEPWLRTLDGYTEVSPSGRGVKVLMRCDKSFATPRHKLKIADGAVEVYKDRRYFTITGRRLADFSQSDIVDRTCAMCELYSRVFGATEAAKPVAAPGKVTSSTCDADSDEEVIRHLQGMSDGATFSRLWTGEDATTSDRSHGDFALCCLLAWRIGPNPVRLDQLFRKSGRIRPKWDELRGETTYGQITIANALARCTEFYQPKGTTAAIAAVPARQRAEPETDLANAQELVRRHGGKLRYCFPWDRWLVWDSRRWRIDDTGQPERLAKETVCAMAAEARDRVHQLSKLAEAQCGDIREQTNGKIKAATAQLKWAIKSQHRPRLNAMLGLARSEPGIPLLPGDLDQHLYYFNAANGTIDLRTGELLPHNPADYLTKISAVAYDPTADCPQFLRFLDSVFPATGDAAEVAGYEPIINFVHRFFGYCLTGCVSEQVVLLMHGHGSNGKSVLLAALAEVFGEYARKLPSGFLLSQKSDKHPTELVELFGTRLAFGTEPDENRRLDESRLKELTGGDALSARRMNENFWTFKPTHKLVLAANHRPTTEGMDHGLWRRIRLLPFEQRFWNPDDPVAPGEERPPHLQQDKFLATRLAAEMPGILQWLVIGSMKWCAGGGLAPPDEVLAATSEYRSEQDRSEAFVDEVCVCRPECKIKSSQLYKEYAKWCDANSERAMASQKFARVIEHRGFARKKNGVFYFMGIDVKPQAAEPSF